MKKKILFLSLILGISIPAITTTLVSCSSKDGSSENKNEGTISPDTNPNPDPAPNPDTNPNPDPNPDPAPTPNPSPDPAPTPNPNPDPAPNPDTNPTPTPNPNPSPSPDPNPTPTPTKPIDVLTEMFNAKNNDPISKLPYTDDFYTQDQINSKITQFINDNDLEVDKIIEKWANNYLSNFIVSRGNSCTGKIIENTIKITEKNTINGNIKFEFTWTKDMNHSSLASSRAANDTEVQNFVFENVKIESYINNGLANYLSFYIQPTKIEKKLDTTVQNQNSYNLSFNGMYKIYLDKFIDFKIQLNNSLFSLNLEKYINNLNSYIIATQDEKDFITEVFSKIVNSDAQFLLFGQNPTDNKQIDQPILKIDLSKAYNVSSSLLTNFVCDLNVLLSFINEKLNSKIDGSTLYLTCKKALNTFIPANNPNVIDLNTNLPYANVYRDHRFLFDSYRENIDLKNKLIENNQSKITNSNWLEYLNSLTDTQKAQKIYEFSLPFVSYGAKDSQVSETTGYINGKVLCDGYSKVFSYIGSLLAIPTIKIVGSVFDGAVPGQTASGGIHAWDLIKVDGEWLWCDPTWDDSLAPGSITYSDINFLKTTAQFFTPQTHVSVNNWDAGASLPISVHN